MLSLVWYYFPVYGGVHWFTGPIPTVDRSAESSVRDSLEKTQEKDVSVSERDV